jgi:ferredoxin--NADP+ reductase/benzoate/toluate 1,2-dioxygenase reductase subunit
MNTIAAVDQFLVESVKDLNESTYVLRFSRSGMQFVPGQHLSIGIEGSREHREYSIYSGVNDDFIEVLIKEVDDGQVSSQLRKVRRGDPLSVKGPFGFFLSDGSKAPDARILFIASGTGIAPFHSFIMSHNNVNYTLIHGIRDIHEAYEKHHYREGVYISCTSRGNKGDYQGRITDYLLEDALPEADKVYLCGNSNMIYDSIDILRARGYRHDQIFTEVYF